MKNIKLTCIVGVDTILRVPSEVDLKHCDVQVKALGTFIGLLYLDKEFEKSTDIVKGQMVISQRGDFPVFRLSGFYGMLLILNPVVSHSITDL